MERTDVETCEISYDFILNWDRNHALMHMSRKVSMRWVAIVYRPTGVETIARSEAFPFQWVNDPKDIEPTQSANRAMTQLVERLRRDDWVATTGGKYWFNRRFRRSRDAS
ncbi:MAG: hypothetical protein ACOC9Y_00190 [Chloroflexota bacterium]